MPSLADDLRTAPATIRPFRPDPVQPAALQRAAARARLPVWRLRAITGATTKRAVRDAHLACWDEHLRASGGLRILAADAPAGQARRLRGADAFARGCHEAPVHLVVLERRSGPLGAGALSDLRAALHAEGLDATALPFAERAEPQLRELLALDDDLTITGVLVARPYR